jgi:hypothetical protein
MLVVSHEMFDKVIARATAIAEEQFRRLVFDTDMRLEAAELVRERVVDATAERIIERWAEKANERAEKKMRRDYLRAGADKPTPPEAA